MAFQAQASRTPVAPSHFGSCAADKPITMPWLYQDQWPFPRDASLFQISTRGKSDDN